MVESIHLIDIIEPTFEKISNAELLNEGVEILPEDKLSLFDDKKFEKFVEAWAFGCQSEKYSHVKKMGGANDKGIDIICYYPDENIDIYQCKKYQSAITPTDFYLELGKLIYYSFNNFYPIPNNYYIVSPKGIGPKLAHLMNDNKLAQALIENWDQYCKSQITKTNDIELNEELKTYIKNFNFKIISELDIKNVIAEFKDCKYFSYFFGLKLLKKPELKKIPTGIQSHEINYVHKLLEAYGSVDHTEIRDKDTLNDNFRKHFERQRTCFYSAESLRVFTEKSFYSNDPYIELRNQILIPVDSKILIKNYQNGLEKLEDAISVAASITIRNNPLQNITTLIDQLGVLHQRANDDDDFRWVNE